MAQEGSTNLQVFVSGPGDTAEEQEIVDRHVRGMNRGELRRFGLHLETFMWAKDAIPGFSDYAQAVINEQTEHFWDIHLGIFAERLGTRTPVAGSGSEEEYNRALARWKADRRSCRIGMFFRADHASPHTDSAERRRLEDFKRRVSESGGFQGLYADTVDFSVRVRNYLVALALSYGDEWGPRELPAHPQATDQSALKLAIAAGEAVTVFLKVVEAMTTELARLDADTRSWAALLASIPEGKGRKQRRAAISGASQALLERGDALFYQAQVMPQAWGDTAAAYFALIAHEGFASEFSSKAGETFFAHLEQARAEVDSALAGLAGILEVSSTWARYVDPIGHASRRLRNAVLKLMLVFSDAQLDIVDVLAYGRARLS